MSSPPNVSRQPSSQPLPRCGECGQRSAIWAGSMLLPYAAYIATADQRTMRSARRGDLTGHRRGRVPHRADRPEWGIVSQPRARIVIIGGGPGGYEAALVAAQLGAEVTVVDRDGLGGACVLTDCVPSKTLIATSGMMAALDGARGAGLRGIRASDCRRGPGRHRALATVDAPRLYARVKALARAQSADVAAAAGGRGGRGHRPGPGGWPARARSRSGTPQISAGRRC